MIGETTRQASLADIYKNLPRISFKWRKKRNRKKNSFPDIVLQSIAAKLAWFSNGLRNRRIVYIGGSTEIHGTKSKEGTKQKTCVRAHPDYRETGLWMDWIDVCWEAENDGEEPSILPAQVLMILDFDSVVYEDIPQSILDLFPLLTETTDDDSLGEKRSGIHLLVHSAGSAVDDNSTHYNPSTHSVVDRFIMEPFFQIIELHNVHSIVYVARDSTLLDDDPMIYEISRVANPQHWGHLFLPHFAQNYQHPSQDQRHLDEFNALLNPW
jgi:hypothetical protein